MPYEALETINCLTEIVSVDEGKCAGGIPALRSTSFREMKRLFKACSTSVRLPPGKYFLVRYDREIAVLERIQLGSPRRAQIFWITETRNLLQGHPTYSHDLPIVVESGSRRPCVHHKPPHHFASLWHYMDDWKFRSWLEEGGIFLTRADRLKPNDGREGTLALGNIRYRNQVYQKGETMAGAYYLYSQELERISRHTYISCWRIDEREHQGCWSDYTTGGESVAIRTNYDAILRHTHTVFCACVEYIDFIKDWVAEGNSVYPFMYKSKEDWEWESEFRLIYQELPKSDVVFRDTPSFDCSGENPNCGVVLTLDLSRMIQQIVLAPRASANFHKEIETLCVKHNLAGRVSSSRFQ